MPGLVYRAADGTDWPQILKLANDSVAHIVGAGDQSEWLKNRRACRSERRNHFVAVRDDAVLGYGGMEAHSTDSRRFRLFVVTRPAERASVGAGLLEGLFARLDAAGAEEAWFIEYAADTAFLDFLTANGFVEMHRVPLAEDMEGIAMSRRGPFSGCAGPPRRIALSDDFQSTMLLAKSNKGLGDCSIFPAKSQS